MKMRVMKIRMMKMSPDPDPHTDPSPTERDVQMMSRAIALADEAANLGEVPVGAVVYDTTSGKVLGEAHNTREMHKNPAGHAEFSAIVQACESIDDWRLNHCTLVVTLEPCPMCAGLIVNARVGRLVFGASDPKAGAVRTLYRLCEDPQLNHRCEVIAGIKADQCSEQLSTFFRTLRKKPTRSTDSESH